MSVSLILRLHENRLACQCNSEESPWDLAIDNDVVNRWRGWGGEYEGVLARDDPDRATALGRALYAFLDGEDHWLARSLEAHPDGEILKEKAGMPISAIVYVVLASFLKSGRDAQVWRIDARSDPRIISPNKESQRSRNWNPLPTHFSFFI